MVTPASSRVPFTAADRIKLAVECARWFGVPLSCLFITEPDGLIPIATLERGRDRDTDPDTFGAG